MQKNGSESENKLEEGDGIRKERLVCEVFIVGSSWSMSLNLNI